MVADPDDTRLQVGVEVEPGGDPAGVETALGKDGEGRAALVGAERLAAFEGQRDGDGHERLDAKPGRQPGAALDPADGRARTDARGEATVEAPQEARAGLAAAQLAVCGKRRRP